MNFKTLSLYADFLSLLRKKFAKAQKYIQLGDMRLSFKLLNTSAISAESKLTYAYLFLNRRDATGVTIPALSNILGIEPGIIRQSLKELEYKKHISLITSKPNHDLSAVIYYYDIVDPAKYQMLNLEENPTL
jgi:hypothetical protein